MKKPAILTLGFVVVVALLAIGGFMLPRRITVERATVIDASPEVVFAVIDSLRAFSRWSPWTDTDADTKAVLQGPENGVGQKLIWQNKSTASQIGTVEITGATADEKVAYHIETARGGDFDSAIVLAPDPGGTKVTWQFALDTGENPFERYVSLLMRGRVGEDYVRGLVNLKGYVEALPKVDTTGLVVSRVKVAPQPLIMMSTFSEDSPASMASTLAQAFQLLGKTVDELGLTRAGAPISLAKGIENAKVAFTAALPVKAVPIGLKLPDGMQVGAMDEGDALMAVHRGSFATLSDTYVQLLTYALTNGWRIKGSSWNEYESGPAVSADGELETDIYLPVK